jgi:hypothetical protein
VTIVSGEVVTDVDFGYVDTFDLVIDKATSGEPQPNEALSFVLTLTNQGPGTAVGPIEVTDSEPAIFSVTDVVEPAGWACAVAGQDVVCAFAGSLAAGESAVITIATTVIGAQGDQATNTAVVDISGPVPESNPNNNTDSVVVTIGRLPRTGAEFGRVVPFGAWLLALGLALVLIGRRRDDAEAVVEFDER